MLSRQLAVEWGPHGVRSNVVSPGLVRTPMSESFYQDPAVAQRRAAAIPIGRIGTPQDMAQVVLFLASDRSENIVVWEWGRPQLLFFGGVRACSGVVHV